MGRRGDRASEREREREREREEREAKGLTAFNGFEFDIPFIHKQFAVCTPPHDFT